jgi:hypothetical protein
MYYQATLQCRGQYAARELRVEWDFSSLTNHQCVNLTSYSYLHNHRNGDNNQTHQSVSDLLFH